jgi:hypothetical protein
MQLIRIGNDTYLNLDALALVEPDRGAGINGEARLRVAFAGGTEVRLTGARADALLTHLAAEALPVPGLAVPDEEHIA